MFKQKQNKTKQVEAAHMASTHGATSVFTLILLACCLMFAAANPSAASVNAGDKLMMDRFLRWQAAYNRSYATAEEKQRRFDVYRLNMEYIEATNRAGNLTYQLGENQFTDLTSEEFLDMYTMKGPIHNSRSKAANASSSEGVAVDAPTSVDWRSQGAVTPIKNQGQCRTFLSPILTASRLFYFKRILVMRCTLLCRELLGVCDGCYDREPEQDQNREAGVTV
jgi:KDEL-tailed cysteine endopeptidase